MVGASYAPAMGEVRTFCQICQPSCVAAANPGANPNELLPVGEGSFEPLSSQAHMTGIAVIVAPA